MSQLQLDVLNHWSNWTNHPTTRCLSTEEFRHIANGFAEADSPDPAVAREAILEDLQPVAPEEPRPQSALARYGSSNGRTKLNEWQVCLIRSMHTIWGMNVAQLAQRWQLPRETVRDIVKRRTWKHV